MILLSSLQFPLPLGVCLVMRVSRSSEKDRHDGQRSERGQRGVDEEEYEEWMRRMLEESAAAEGV